MKRSIALVLLGSTAVFGFAPAALPQPTSSSALFAKRGKGLSGVGGGSKLSKPQSIAGSETQQQSSAPKSNWQETAIKGIKSLPQDKNVVKVVETNVFALKDKGTNPKGAVSIVNYEDKTYCFSSSCGSCKIPLTKGKVLDPTDETGDDARLQCDFCGATYNLRTGAPVQKEGTKLLGFLFSKSDDEELPVYGLGEQGGKVFINVP